MSEQHRSTPLSKAMTRRTVLRGLAGLGAVTATGGLLAACGGSASTAAPATPAPPSSGPGASAPPDGTPSSEPTTPAQPTEPPKPESELFVYNYDEYIGEDTIPSFEDKYRDPGHLRRVHQLRRDDHQDLDRQQRV